MRISNFISAVCVAIALPILAAGVICVRNPDDGLLYLIDIFTQAILTTSVLLTLAIVLLRRYVIAGIAGLGIALMLVSIVPQAVPGKAAVDSQGKPVTLMWSNMFIRNPAPQKILPWVAEKKPDIVVLAEVTAPRRKELTDALGASYPHMLQLNDIIVASKYPLGKPKSRVKGFAGYNIPVTTPHGRINLVAVHLTRPWPYTQPGVQPAQFDHLYDGLEPLPETGMILVGDFNSSPYAAHLRDFAKRRKMSLSYGLSGTWPAPFPGFVRGSIDNVLVSRDLHLSKRQVGPNTGSDHSPIYVEIRPTTAEKP